VSEPDRPDLTKKFPPAPDNSGQSQFSPPPSGQQPQYQQPQYQQPQYEQPQYQQPQWDQQPQYQQPFAQPGYGAPVDPGAPYGRDPMTGQPFSDKSKLLAGLLQIVPVFVGLPIGIGRFYMGSNGIGVAMAVLTVVSYLLIFTLIGALLGLPVLFATGIWAIVDGVILLTGKPRDGAGRLLRN
jgi:TM2 domain-containing membrane protein YozV